MMTVTLMYTDAGDEARNVFRVLARNNIKILKTRLFELDTMHRVKIWVKDTNELNKLLLELNNDSHYGVRVKNAHFDKPQKKLFMTFSKSNKKHTTNEKASISWIDVKTKTPEPFVSVLCYLPSDDPLPTVHEGYLSDNGTWHVGYYDRKNGEVTHWAEMPKYSNK